MSELSQRSGNPYWLIVRGSNRASNRQKKDLEVFVLGSEGGGRLPLFHSNESAERFRLGVPASEGEWRTRATGAGELISLLSGSAFDAGPCAGVERILLDPPPEAVDHFVREGEMYESLAYENLAAESRGCFLERLMGRGRTWFETRDRKESK